MSITTDRTMSCATSRSGRPPCSGLGRRSGLVATSPALGGGRHAGMVAIPVATNNDGTEMEMTPDQLSEMVDFIRVERERLGRADDHL